MTPRHRWPGRSLAFAIVPPVRVLRTLIVAAVLALGVAAPAAAQTSTTTTMPPVRSIPVTPAPTTTTSTTARATTPTTAAVGGTVAGAPVEGDPLATTGVAADVLVPLGFLLIALGALLDAGVRRSQRPAPFFS